MPPVSAVPVDLAVKVLKKYIAHFANEVPPWKSEVWKKITNDPDLKGKWSIGSVRTNVREDRRGILSEARRQCGITVNIIPNEKSDLNEYCDISEESVEDWYEEYLNEESDSENDDIHKLERFTVEISRDVWNEIYNLKVYKGRKYVGFKPKVWTNAVSNAFWKQHHLKCAFVFKRGRITKKGKSYATIIGRCRAKDCQNPVKGIIKDCPGEVGPVYIEMFCRDTRFVKHEDVKRPLNGTERLKVQEELLKTPASAWRKAKARDNMDPGDTSSPFVYKPNTLHQAKKEAQNKKLGIETDDTQDMILVIRNMNVDPSYVNSNLATGDSQFYVCYEWTAYEIPKKKEENDINNYNDIIFVNRESKNNDSFICHDHDYLIKLENLENFSSSSQITEISPNKNNHNDYKKNFNIATDLPSIEVRKECFLKALEIHKNKSDSKKETKHFQNYPKIKLQNNLINDK